MTKVISGQECIKSGIDFSRQAYGDGMTHEKSNSTIEVFADPAHAIFPRMKELKYDTASDYSIVIAMKTRCHDIQAPIAVRHYIFVEESLSIFFVIVTPLVKTEFGQLLPNMRHSYIKGLIAGLESRLGQDQFHEPCRSAPWRRKNKDVRICARDVDVGEGLYGLSHRTEHEALLLLVRGVGVLSGAHVFPYVKCVH